jgi:hypothetical protein
MIIIGCDFHTRYQQIAMLDDTTGELVERHLEHESGEAQKFYRDLSKPVRVGVEATGPLHWFERLLAELGHELWIGNSSAGPVGPGLLSAESVRLLRRSCSAQKCYPCLRYVVSPMCPGRTP